MKRWELYRDGGAETRAVVAQAVELDDGRVVVRWLGNSPSTSIHDRTDPVAWILSLDESDVGPRRFAFDRDEDPSGVSGVGRVAVGCLWLDGSALVAWQGEHPSVVHWPSLDDAVATHGHGGLTRLVWLDPEAGS